MAKRLKVLTREEIAMVHAAGLRVGQPEVVQVHCESRNGPDVDVPPLQEQIARHRNRGGGPVFAPLVLQVK